MGRPAGWMKELTARPATTLPWNRSSRSCGRTFSIGTLDDQGRTRGSGLPLDRSQIPPEMEEESTRPTNATRVRTLACQPDGLIRASPKLGVIHFDLVVRPHRTDLDS